MVRKLDVQDLAWHCPDEWIQWSSSDEVEPVEGIVGQDRAVRAIAFGLGMRGVGYNIFVTGLSGTGRLTTIKQFLEGRGGGRPLPDDVCFVYNFQKPDEPQALILATGAGRRFRDGMDNLLEEFGKSLPAMFKDKAFAKRLEKAVGGLQNKEQGVISEFEKEVEEAGFVLVQVQVGPIARPEVLPVVDDEPVALEELEKLVVDGGMDAAQAESIHEKHEVLKSRLHGVFEDVADLRRQIQARAEKVRSEILCPVLDDAVHRLGEAVDDPRLSQYLEGLRVDLEERIEIFGAENEPEGDRFLRWRVNLAVDNSRLSGLPVVLETEPTYSNLFGSIERSLSSSGEASTSFMKIRAGSLLCANGGFLVLNAEDLLMEGRVWPGLKRALKYGRVKIQSIEGMLFGASALKPEAVPLDVKVVVIGDRAVYDMLYRYDRDFSKVFKVLADFDVVMPTIKERARDVISVISKVIAEDKLLNLDTSGMACLVEDSVRLARGRRKFSSRFSDLADLIREASWIAQENGAEAVGRNHVRMAREAARVRHSLSEDRTHEYVEEGVIRIATEGSEVGRINGLAVYDVGHHRFGRPSRISARVGIGREGVINIERQAGLSGPTHDKGIQILTGFLRGTFARTVPLSMACSVTFEQSYGGVDGDSASSTEIYAILSALADLPLRQDVAVTGSVDQYGSIQSIGGVNAKIEGFFRVCESRGLTGTQGVMIPASDVNDLHLADQVIEKVQAGLFHVWAVDSIEDGIEHLTGIQAGELDEDGNWTADSVYALCEAQLKKMAQYLRSAGKADSESPEEDNGASDEKDGRNEREGDEG
ncbi:MAG: AAA family ATPase [Thermoanaerobaculales bacterium]|nr:AAA family ATPase [Thermoanaerobaculales bacterium]